MATEKENAAAFLKVEDAIARWTASHEYGEAVNPALPHASNTTMQSFRFVDLPIEPTVRILKLLPGVEVVRFQRVSKNSQKLIKGSVDFQYHIERYLAGTVEGNSTSSVSLPERLSATRKWREAWVNFAHTKVYNAPDQSSLGQGIANGPIHVRRIGPNIPWGFVECRSLEFGLLPSALRKSNGREWTLTDLPPFHNFACDYDQELLVLVSKRMANTKVTVHFLSSDTGNAHSLASSSTLEVFGSHVSDAMFFFEVDVLGDLVCLQMVSGGQNEPLGQLWVINWKTGQTCMNIHGAGFCPKDFAFLDADHILVVPPPEYPRQIFVFNCRTFPSGVFTLDQALENSRLILELPTLNEDCQCEEISISCRPIRSTPPSRGDGALFYWANKLPVVRIWLFMLDDEDDDWAVDILIPGSTILSRISGRRDVPLLGRTVPWSDWQEETRMVDTLRAHDTHGVCGSRYITISTGGDDGDDDEASSPHFVIYDFDSPPAMLKDIMSGDADVGRRFLHGESKTCPGSSVMSLFEDEVDARAPCRIIRTGIPAEGNGAAELCEDGVIVRAKHGNHEMRVYTI